MKVVNFKLTEIKPYENNPRDNARAISKVAESIRQFGFKVPIIVDKDNVIITGHTRYLASQELGLEEVPVIVAEDLTEEKVKAFRLADNKVSEYSTWNDDLLKVELEDLIDLDFDINSIGFSEIELMELTEDIEAEEYDNEEIEDYVEQAEEKLKAVNIVVSCFDEEEQEWIRTLFRESSEIRRLYKARDIMERYGENN